MSFPDEELIAGQTKKTPTRDREAGKIHWSVISEMMGHQLATIRALI